MPSCRVRSGQQEKRLEKGNSSPRSQMRKSGRFSALRPPIPPTHSPPKNPHQFFSFLKSFEINPLSGPTVRTHSRIVRTKVTTHYIRTPFSSKYMGPAKDSLLLHLPHGNKRTHLFSRAFFSEVRCLLERERVDWVFRSTVNLSGSICKVCASVEMGRWKMVSGEECWRPMYLFLERFRRMSSEDLDTRRGNRRSWWS